MNTQEKKSWPLQRSGIQTRWLLCCSLFWTNLAWSHAERRVRLSIQQSLVRNIPRSLPQKQAQTLTVGTMHKLHTDRLTCAPTDSTGSTTIGRRGILTQQRYGPRRTLKLRRLGARQMDTSKKEYKIAVLAQRRDNRCFYAHKMCSEM